MSPHGHFNIGPVNWSDIESIETRDISKADSAEFDNRNEYVLIIHTIDQTNWLSFGRDYELRDKIYALIVNHQTACLRAY